MRLGALQCRVAGGGGEPELKEGILGTEGEVLGGGVGVCVCVRGHAREGCVCVVWCSDPTPDLAKGDGDKSTLPSLEPLCGVGEEVAEWS